MEYTAPVQFAVSVFSLPKEWAHYQNLCLRFDDNEANICEETEEQPYDEKIIFQTSLKVMYEFWRTQTIIFTLLNKQPQSEIIKVATCKLDLDYILLSEGDLHNAKMVSKEQEFTIDLSIKHSNSQINASLMKMNWFLTKLKNKIFGKRNPKLVFLRMDPNGNQPIYETEVHQNTCEALFKPFEINLAQLCNNDHTANFQIDCYSVKKDNSLKLMGSVITTVEHLKTNKELDLLKKGKGKVKGHLTLMSHQIIPKFEIIDYFKGGMEINLIVGVDFTSSNGDPKKANTHHSLLDPLKPNHYQAAMRDISTVLLKYSRSKEVSAWGFGAKPNFPQLTNTQVSHCFPLTGIPGQNQVKFEEGLEEVYKKAVMSVNMWGPTMFAEVLGEAVKVAKATWEKQENVYHVVLILTDGELHDFDASAEKIKEMSTLPISVVFIGIGDEDFTNIKSLSLNTKHENVFLRECSLFLAVKEFIEFRQMIKRALNTISNQICNFMKVNSKKPTHLEHAEIPGMTALKKKIEESKTDEKPAPTNKLNLPAYAFNQRKSAHFENLEKLYHGLDKKEIDEKLSNETVATDFL